ncbi:MAG TPA: PP2C family serine/threonine-protein phosphatase [Candidatus Saccharimonadales bacterium]|nr:PP2C family serine/threonine-protein phosphatase [Candidatus Saccharimonadales bacterium]
MTEAHKPTNEQAPPPPSDEALTIVLPAEGEAGEEQEQEVVLELDYDPRFTEQRVEALKGPVRPEELSEEENEEHQLRLTDYIGTDTQEALSDGTRDGKITHLVTLEDKEGDVGIAPLDALVFPEDRRGTLAELGVQLNEAGMITDIDPAPEEPNEPQEAEEATPADHQEEQETTHASADDKLPESITNNFNIHQRESGLLVAESRAYHSSLHHKSDQPLPIPGITGPIPDKQRGIVETDTELAGKPFVVAERPPSKPARHTEAESDSIEDELRKLSENRDPRFDAATVKALQGPATAIKDENSEELDVEIVNYIGSDDESHYMFTTPQNDSEIAMGIPLDALRFSEERQKQLREAGVNLEELLAMPKDKESLPTIGPEKTNFEIEVGHTQESVQGEDTLLARQDLRLFGIFDGLGSVVNADKASQAAYRAIEEAYEAREKQPKDTGEAIQFAGYAFGLARQRASETGGYTAGLFAKIEKIDGKDFMIWANAGNSRLFRLRSDGKGQLEEISTPQANEKGLLNWLGPSLDPQSDEFKPHQEPMVIQGKDEFGIIELGDEDRLMLCSNSVVANGSTLTSYKELDEAFDIDLPQESAKRFLELSKNDETDRSVIVIAVSEPED